jgi:hypothetical protein
MKIKFWYFHSFWQEKLVCGTAFQRVKCGKKWHFLLVGELWAAVWDAKWLAWRILCTLSYTGTHSIRLGNKSLVSCEHQNFTQLTQMVRRPNLSQKQEIFSNDFQAFLLKIMFTAVITAICSRSRLGYCLLEGKGKAKMPCFAHEQLASSCPTC